VKSSKLPLLLSAMALVLSLGAITPHISSIPKLQIPAWASTSQAQAALTEVRLADGRKIGTAAKDGDMWIFTHTSGKKLAVPDKDVTVAGDHLVIVSMQNSKEVK